MTPHTWPGITKVPISSCGVSKQLTKNTVYGIAITVQFESLYGDEEFR